MLRGIISFYDFLFLPKLILCWRLDWAAGLGQNSQGFMSISQNYLWKNKMKIYLAGQVNKTVYCLCLPTIIYYTV